ncbi:MAG: hypothetical protein HKN47_13670 [Pirellulaceae bacterium]|nr:hypothetical protein [Pirellulaceae bacterium]
MKKLLIATVAAAALTVGSTASASEAPAVPVQIPTQVVVDLDTNAVAARRVRVFGIFGRLIELERRKNAWLRRAFLNG